MNPTIDRKKTAAQIRRVETRLADFYTPEEARLWLQSPHPQLGRARPDALILADRTSEVLEVIERLESGVHL